MRSCVLLLVAALGHARAAGPVFKQEAAEEMRVEHRTSIRGGETVHDYTKLEVEARLLDMLEDPGVVVKDRVLVEHKDSRQQDWAEVAAAPSLRGGVYRWTIADTVPCRDHSVRLTVFGEDGSRNTFYYPHTIVAPRLADIAGSGYRPATPGPVQQGVQGDGSMVLSWAEAACAASYEVIYSPTIGPGDTRSVEVEGTEVTLTGLASCQEYEVSVTAVLGGQYSEDEAKLTFLTLPEAGVAARLEPVVEAGTEDALVRWRGSERLSCVPAYTARLCREDTAECGATVSLDRDDSLQYMEFSAAPGSLAMCSPYTLTIQPVHPEASLEPKLVTFRTRSPPRASLEAALAPVSASLGADQMVTVSWAGVACGEQYSLYRRHPAPEPWTSLATTEATQLQVAAESCSEYIYAVTVTVDGEESGKVEAAGSIVTEVNTEELPVMIVEEKANGSMTFVLKTGEVNTMCEVSFDTIQFPNFSRC